MNTLQSEREAAQAIDRAECEAERAEREAADRESYMAESCACSHGRGDHLGGRHCTQCNCVQFVDDMPPSVVATLPIADRLAYALAWHGAGAAPSTPTLYCHCAHAERWHCIGTCAMCECQGFAPVG